MKKWLVLCAILFTAIHAQEVSLDRLNELMKDLDTIVDDEDGNDTIGELLSGMEEFEDEEGVVGVEQDESVLEGAEDDTVEEFIEVH